jgi:hypothetical protein
VIVTLLDIYTDWSLAYYPTGVVDYGVSIVMKSKIIRL